MLDVWWFFGEEDHDGERQQHDKCCESIDVMPSEVLGEAWGKERGEGGSAVACSSDAHRKSFVLFGKPA